MKNKFNKNGFTFIEVMATMIVLGILFVITVMNLTKLSVDTNMTRFKNGYSALENAINYLLSDHIYGTRQGFKELNDAEISIKDIDGGTGVSTGEIIKGDNEKFRNALKYTLNATKDNLNCKLYKFSTPDDGCFMTDNGVVFGVPNTNFVDIGVISVKDGDGDRIPMVPVTMYVNYDGREKDPKTDAFIIGISYDGNMRFVQTADCDSNPKALQCNLKKYTKSNTISSDNED